MKLEKTHTRFGRLVMLPLAIMLALAAAPFLSSPVSAGEGVPGGIVSGQVRICPADYIDDDFLNDCAPSVDPIGVTLTSGLAPLNQQTDANGQFFYGALEGGFEYTATLEVPGDFANFYYACFDGADVYLFDGSSNQITFEVTDDAEFFCRWYVIPESQGPTGEGSITIQAWICPNFYEGDDFLNDCAPDDGGILVGLNEGELDFVTQLLIETDANGVAAFTDLDGGIHTVNLGVPGDFANFYFACFNADNDVFLFDGETNVFEVDLAVDANLFCRYYVIPESQGPTGDGSITIQAWICPAFYEDDDFLNDCAPTDDGILVGLNEGELDVETQLSIETNVDGVAAFTDLNDGLHTVNLGVPGDFANFYFACFNADNDVFLFDGDTNLFQVNLAVDGDLFCRWYIIPEPQGGVTPTPTATPTTPTTLGGVSQLPSTGAGSAGTTESGLIAAFAAFTIAIVSGFVAIRRSLHPIA